MAETTVTTTAPERKATAAMYRRMFMDLPEGDLILQDLLARFHDRKIFVSGGAEGARETDRRAAQAEVIRFILGQIGQLPEDDGEHGA